MKEVVISNQDQSMIRMNEQKKRNEDGSEEEEEEESEVSGEYGR